MKKLVLLGAGGHCASVIDAIVPGQYDEISILDKEENIGKKIRNYEVIGTDDDLQELYEKGFRYAFIAVGSIKTTSLRRSLLTKVLNVGYQFVNIIDPSAIIAADAKLGTGIFVGKRAVINAGAVIDDMVIINTGAIIEHNCRINDFSHVAVGAVLCGNVHVEKDCFVGANATIIQDVIIPEKSVIGAGALVKKAITENKIEKSRGYLSHKMNVIEITGGGK